MISPECEWQESYTAIPGMKLRSSFYKSLRKILKENSFYLVSCKVMLYALQLIFLGNKIKSC